MWGPRRPAGSLKGQPTVEPRPSAQHRSLAVELASAVTGRAAGMPSRDLGCPRPHYKPRRRGRQARPHVHVHSTRAPLHSRSRWLRYPRFIQRASTQTVRDGSVPRSRSTTDQHCYPTGTPSTRTPSRRRRQHRSLECYFFFTTRPSCTSRSRCPSRRSGSTAGRCSCCICG